MKPLLERARELADDHERFEQGGGAADMLRELADALEAAQMRVYLFEIQTGAYEQTFRQVLAIAPDEDQAKAYICSKYPGWHVAHSNEITSRPVHFTLGDLEE